MAIQKCHIEALAMAETKFERGKYAPVVAIDE